MKRLTIMITAIALTLGMAQCRKQVETIAQPAGGTVDVTVRVENGCDKTDITATGVVTWKKGDKLYVVGSTDGLLGSVSATEAGRTVTFVGVVKNLSAKQTLNFYYVGDKAFTLDGSGNCTFDISAQDGSLAGIASNGQLMYGTAGEVSLGTTDFGTVSMTSVMAIAHLNINDGGAAVSGPVTVTGGKASATFNAKTYNGSALSGTAGNITMTLASGTTSTNCYIALLPGAQTLKFSADGKEATLDEKNVEANKFYNSGTAIAVSVEAPAHEIVNMGLPTPYENLEWSKYNLGVNPDDLDAAADWYGDFYAWGATDTWYSSLSPLTWKPGYSLGYAWETCPGNGGNSSYNEDEFATWKSENLTVNNTLSPEVDAAHVIWGGDWRMPTTTEWKALYDNTTLEWVDSYEGVAVSGCLLKNKLDPSKELFLPAAGLFVGTSHNVAGTMGDYWSSTVVSSSLANAYRVYFGYENGAWMYPQSSTNRVYGFPVRPVCQHQN